MDRVWVFPPMISGRKESGLLAVSLFAAGEDPDRRVLVALPYSAERTGKGLTLEASLLEHGEAPLDRLPRVMEGVVKRTETDLGEPREVEILGSEERLLECLGAFEPDLLDPDLPPLGGPASDDDPASEDGPASEEPQAGEAASVSPFTGPLP